MGKEDTMNITVYLASAPGNDPCYAETAEKLGSWIAESGHTLVYGGANDGTMGIIADSCLKHGGEAIGVMPGFLAARGRKHEGLTEILLTATMAERKAKMIELGDVFIALPGGPGTLEEISEVISCVRLGILDKPVILLNVNGYYDPLHEMFRRMVDTGFLSREDYGVIHFVDTIEEIVQLCSC